MPSYEFSFRNCTFDDLSKILKLQNETISKLPSKDILRNNTEEMLLSCLLSPNTTIGAWHGDTLAAIGVLYIPQDMTEDLAHLLSGVDISGIKTANFKLCIVNEQYRGNSLQYRLGQMLEVHAKKLGIRLLCATVSPKNPYSINNLKKLGYTYNQTLIKYNLERDLYYKIIQ